MKPAISVILLLFVATSVVYLVVSQVRSPADATEPTGALGPGAPAATERAEAAGPKVEPVSPRIIAYYFHTETRCRTCLTMERYAREAIEGRFSAELAAGQVQWRAVNFEKPENEHFVEDFSLTASALVLVRQAEGVAEEPRDLARIWDLVGDEEGFKKYVADEVATLLGRGT